MKHELPFEVQRQDPISGQLMLLPIQGRKDCGAPVLIGYDDALIMNPMPDGDPFSFLAVCKEAQMDGRLVVLGYLSTAQIVSASVSQKQCGDVVIGTDKAQIRLTEDGRVRIKGDDVLLESRTRMALSGAYIDLN